MLKEQISVAIVKYLSADLASFISLKQLEWFYPNSVSLHSLLPLSQIQKYSHRLTTFDLCHYVFSIQKLGEPAHYDKKKPVFAGEDQISM